MRKLILLLGLLASLPVGLFGQAGTYTTLRSGASLPAACNPGGMFYKTAATAGVYKCGPANTWTFVLTQDELDTLVGQMLDANGEPDQQLGITFEDGWAFTGALCEGVVSYTPSTKAWACTDPTFTGTVTIPTPFTLGAVSVLPTGTELNFVDGVTSAIQTQFTAKAPLASPTFTGTVVFPTPFTLGAVSVLPTGTELNFVDGVTSAIQTQLDLKAPLAGPTFTGVVTVPTEVYDETTWNGDFAAADRDAVRDKIESLGAGAGDIEGVTAGAGIGGGGTSGTVTVTTASGETDFLASGALTCGAATQGKAQVHTTPLQYCDNAATPVLQYAAYGTSAGVATSAADLAGTNVIGATEIADLDVASGGTGAATLTGILQGNGTSAITGMSNSSTVGQVFRVTGASTYAWGALDLADADAITGDIPDANLSAAVSLLGATIDDTEMTAEDFGEFTCTGAEGGCTINDNIIDSSELTDDNKTITKDITITSPTTALTNLAQIYWPSANSGMTLIKVECSIDAGTSVTIQLDERAVSTPNTAGTNSMTSALVCDTNSQSTTSFSDSAIAGAVPHNLQITGVSGSVGAVRIHITAVIN